MVKEINFLSFERNQFSHSPLISWWMHLWSDGIAIDENPAVFFARLDEHLWQPLEYRIYSYSYSVFIFESNIFVFGFGFYFWVKYFCICIQFLFLLTNIFIAIGVQNTIPSPLNHSFNLVLLFCELTQFVHRWRNINLPLNITRY